MSAKLSTEDVWNKVDWEGGVDGAMSYGLSPDDFHDEELAVVWRKAQVAYEVYAKARGLVENFLDDWDNNLDEG